MMRTTMVMRRMVGKVMDCRAALCCVVERQRVGMVLDVLQRQPGDCSFV